MPHTEYLFSFPECGELSDELIEMRPILIRCSTSEFGQLEFMGAIEGHLVRGLKGLAGNFVAPGTLSAVVVEKRGCGFVESFQTTGECFRIVIWTFGERFTCHIIKSVHLGAVVRHVINTPRWKMDPTVRNSSENYIVGNVNVND